LKKKFTFSEEYFERETIATLTTLSNGYISVRGDPEFLESKQGTFIAGVYSYTPVFYRELVNLPRAHAIYAEFEGVPLKPENVLYTLDVEHGLLEIESTLTSPLGSFAYKSVRFVHKNIKGLLGIKASIKSLNARGRLFVKAPVELEFSNPSVPQEVSVRLFRVVSLENKAYPRVEVVTADDRYKVYIASVASSVPEAPVNNFTTNSKIGQVLSLDVRPGDILNLERLAVYGFDSSTVDSALTNAKSRGLEGLLQEHMREWEKEWREINLNVSGDEELADSLIFNTFHLLQIYNDQSDVFAIPAKGLHGYGYRGHVFWDTEIYAFPFYLFFKPDAARKILTFRCRLLEAAIENAKRNGYRGAQYPWESADDGVEATPREVPLDLTGSKKVRIYTGDQEHHITADIAYAVDMYYRFTGDKDFLAECGLRILVETARFWTSRVEWDTRLSRYVIRNVIGPDEYHVGVDNNFYTNLMARHNLELAASYSKRAQSDISLRPVLDELRVSSEEITTWENIAEGIYVNCGEDGLCEQFDGYFKLKDYKLDPGVIGEKSLPPSVLQSIQDYQLIKQADVVAAMFLLREKFTREVIEKNYEYYLPRTTHASSLSLPMYAAAALYIGRIEEGLRMLKIAAQADLADVYKNSKDGFHIGSAGGVWMAILFGLLRLREGETITFEGPEKAYGLKLSFNIKYRGKTYRVEL
jgi:kojibiose phosphorylase